MARWHIQGYDDGDNLVLDKWVSGRLGANQIAQVLARLASRHLTEREVVEWGTRAGDRDGLAALIHRSPQDMFTIVDGVGRYTARFEEPDA